MNLRWFTYSFSLFLTDSFSDEVFTFKKTMLDRLNEIERVLKSPDRKISASDVKKEWQNFMEVAIEPAGWQAVWKISRCLCEVLGARYPLEVLGTADQVNFQDLSCTFTIEAVQDESVELPEKYEVPLIELWLTKAQENEALNVEMTAEAIDTLRYFYNHIWMPWDETDADETKDWATSFLTQRVNFHYDLTSKKMHPSLISYARHLLSEIRYAAKHKVLIESDMTEEELETLLGDEDVTNPKLLELMRLNFRINSIKNELVALENPVMRNYYEKIKFNGSHSGVESFKRISLGLDDEETDQRKSDSFVIAPRSNIHMLIDGISAVKEIIDEKSKVEVRHSLQNLLDTCSKFKQVFLLPGDHFLIFSEYLYGECEITAIEGSSIIKARDNEISLLTLDGKFIFENITFDCSNVRGAVMVKGGQVTFRNCRFLGELTSNTSEAVTVAGNFIHKLSISDFGLIFPLSLCFYFHSF